MLHFNIALYLEITYAFYFTRHLRLKLEATSYFVSLMVKAANILCEEVSYSTSQEDLLLLKHFQEHQNNCMNVHIHKNNIKL